MLWKIINLWEKEAGFLKKLILPIWLLNYFNSIKKKYFIVINFIFYNLLINTNPLITRSVKRQNYLGEFYPVY